MEDAPFGTVRLLTLVLLSNLVVVFTVTIGFIGHFFYWLIFDIVGGSIQRRNRKLNLPKDQKKDEYYALIIGSGFSGLGMAIKLNELGMDDYIIIERHGHLGGTWYANT
jgi:hypothetical protein